MNQALDVLDAFFKREVPRLKDTYNWKIPNIEGFEYSGCSGYLPNIELKRYLNNIWEKSDFEGRVRLSKFIVGDWGGVRSNSDKTIEAYVKITQEDSWDSPIKGVASYSKIFSIVNPQRFAIYDARVAACINAVQLNADVHKGVAFNYVPGRNNVVGNTLKKQGFTQQPSFSVRELCMSGWKRVGRDNTYREYLKILQKCLERYEEASLVQLEMALFANAEIECRKAMSRLDNNYF